MISTHRRLIEDYPALDVIHLARVGALVPGDHTWSWAEGGGLIVRLISLGDRVEIRIHGCTFGEVDLTWTPCNFGGSRVWWMCPRCVRRTAKVHIISGALACRRCADLSYGSQLEREIARGLRRARKIRERLGGRPGLVEPFPRKPKRMHWATYNGLREEVGLAEGAYLASVGTMAARLRIRRDVLVTRGRATQTDACG